MSAPLEQFDAEFLLEITDLLAQRGLSYTNPLCGAGKVHLRYHREDFQTLLACRFLPTNTSPGEVPVGSGVSEVLAAFVTTPAGP
jgi:hypothetical protein